LQLAVLNPSGRDPEQDFADLAGEPNATSHPPVNLHAYAACTRGAFHRSIETIAPERNQVLLVLRRNLKHCLAVLIDLQTRGKTVAVTLKEAGLHQVAELLGKKGTWPLLCEICERANGCLSTTPELTALYAAMGARRVRFIPTPYPIDDARWNFQIPFEQRSGIFIGTREIHVLSRNHVAAVLAARSIGQTNGEHATVINTDQWRGQRLLGQLRFPAGRLEIINRRLPYPDYLRLIARHKVVLQFDRSAVPGQVAGDALLCGIPCVGGDGAIERIVFPETNGFGRNFEELTQLASRLCCDQTYYTHVIAESRCIAIEELGFAAGAEKLKRFFEEMKGAS
jgi:hypothetical protein